MRNATLELTNRSIRIVYLHLLGMPTSAIARDPAVGLSPARTGVVLRTSLADPQLVTAARLMFKYKRDAALVAERLAGYD